MRNIIVDISGRVATLTGDLRSLVCDNTDYALTFVFDDEWQGVRDKIARLVYKTDEGVKYVDVAFSGDRVQLPPLHMVSVLYVGVYAGLPGTQPLLCSTPVRISCSPSALSNEGIYDDLGGSEMPEPDEGMLYLTNENGIYLTDEKGNFYTMEVEE